MAESKAAVITPEQKTPAAYLEEARKILEGDASIPVQREHLLALRPEWAIAPLGEPQVYAKVTAEGRLIAIKVSVSLREELGHLYEVRGKMSISNLGYHELNKYAGVSLVGPLRLITPEGEKPNPWMEFDSATGFIKSVWVRRVAFGFSPVGNLSVIDRSVHFDLRTYLIEELAKQASRTPAMGGFVIADQLGDHEKAKGKKGWYIPLVQPMGLWLDTAHPEVVTALETYTQRIKFAERIATSIAERNALRAHPAIAKSQVEASGPKPRRWTTLTVFGFRHDLDRRQVDRLSLAVADDDMDRLKAEAAALDIRAVEHDVKTVKPDEEDVGGTEPENGDEAEIPEEETVSAPARSTVPEEIGGERQQALADLRLARAALADEKAFFGMAEKQGIKTTLAEAPIERLKGLLSAVSREVDKKQAKMNERAKK